MSTALVGRAGTPVALGFAFSAGASAAHLIGQIVVGATTFLVLRRLSLRLWAEIGE
ncbi:hypothetical protein JOF56_003837 [Kibdelosporangium banguiense]|uniref:Uncharacterized protein n=1 Tax=Kibdelosporangium banguiense TaxID=1365924 RepID=A0ABS4TGA6_9PSEU|nr:hypothetical protein [Kibdelosporangium banguiense]